MANGNGNGKDFRKLSEIVLVAKVLNYGTILYGLVGLAFWRFEVKGLSFYFALLYGFVLFGSTAINQVLKYYDISSGKRRGGFYVCYLLVCYSIMEFWNVYRVSSLHANAHPFPEGFPSSVIEAVGLYLTSLLVSAILHCRSNCKETSWCDGGNCDCGNNTKKQLEGELL